MLPPILVVQFLIALHTLVGLFLSMTQLSLPFVANKVLQLEYTTKAKLDAATTLMKLILWLHTYMDDMSLPCMDAIVMYQKVWYNRH